MNNTNEAVIIWKSTDDNPKAVTPAGDPFMVIKKARGYYYYAERGGQDSIAFILYNAETNQVGLISESKPPMDERGERKVMMTTAFGGSIDKVGSIKEICKEEVLEESGYNVSDDRISYVGETLASTQMSQIVYGYMVDITGLTPGKTEADIQNDAQDAKDPDEFIHNKVIWLSYDECMTNSDWKSIWILAKMYWENMKKVSDEIDSMNPNG